MCVFILIDPCKKNAYQESDVNQITAVEPLASNHPNVRKGGRPAERWSPKKGLKRDLTDETKFSIMDKWSLRVRIAYEILTNFSQNSVLIYKKGCYKNSVSQITVVSYLSCCTQ